jgi:predicted nuclease with TOPRIM domain
MDQELYRALIRIRDNIGHLKADPEVLTAVTFLVSSLEQVMEQRDRLVERLEGAEKRYNHLLSRVEDITREQKAVEEQMEALQAEVEKTKLILSLSETVLCFDEDDPPLPESLTSRKLRIH